MHTTTTKKFLLLLLLLLLLDDSNVDMWEAPKCLGELLPKLSSSSFLFGATVATCDTCLVLSMLLLLLMMLCILLRNYHLPTNKT